MFRTIVSARSMGDATRGRDRNHPCHIGDVPAPAGRHPDFQPAAGISAGTDPPPAGTARPRHGRRLVLDARRAAQRGSSARTMACQSARPHRGRHLRSAVRRGLCRRVLGPKPIRHRRHLRAGGSCRRDGYRSVRVEPGSARHRPATGRGRSFRDCRGNVVEQHAQGGVCSGVFRRALETQHTRCARRSPCSLHASIGPTRMHSPLD